MVHWGFGFKFGQTKVILLLYLFYLESMCSGGIGQEVLHFGKNLNNLHLPLIAL